MPIMRKKWIYREDLVENRDVLFVFGDNIVEEGYGGQAKEMRGEINAVGIPTKYIPATSRDAYFSDDSFMQVKPFIDERLDIIEQHLQRSGIVVLPEDGIGTGLARLAKKAPLIYNYINQQLSNLEQQYKL